MLVHATSRRRSNSKVLLQALRDRMVVSVEDIVPAPRQQQSVSRASARASMRRRVTVRGGTHDPQRHDR
jgi:hypothetical protein